MHVFVAGTRPELIKITPIIRELRSRDLPHRIILTGQHTDLARGILPPGTVCAVLGIASRNEPAEYVERATDALWRTLHGFRGKYTVVVQGDTASALAGARAVDFVQHDLVHVEAGLRSGCRDDPWPEEGFRTEIDKLAQWKMCPTIGNVGNLLKEGTASGAIQTGNTVADALRIAGISPATQAVREDGPVLITLHRRESFGEPLKRIVAGIAEVAREHPSRAFCWVTHPNPEVMKVAETAQIPPNVLKRGPLPYASFVELLRASRMVITDSGGLVEECTTLGIPVVVCRDHTERPEACEVGTAVLAGRTQAGVVSAARRFLEDEVFWRVKPSAVFGDGYAARRIVNHFTRVVNEITTSAV